MLSTIWNNLGEQTITIQGPEGDLEAVVTIPADRNTDYVALICHPHSLHGGTMNNKVVTTLAKVFNELGIASVRFNFRGVGASQGNFANGVGEVNDLLRVITWVKSYFPTVKIALAGFSFGSFVAYQASRQINPVVLISVAPPIHHFDFDIEHFPSCPWIIVQGEEDEIVSATNVFKWIDTLPRQVTVLRFPNTNHFFHGKLILLREQLLPVIKKMLA